MAWEPSSSTWDWDADGAIVQGHVNGLDHRKLPVSVWPCELERCEIKHDRSSSQSRFAGSFRADPTGIGDFLCNQVVTPAMANIHSSLFFNDTGSPSNVGPMLQARAPIETTSVGCGLLSRSNNNANGSLESVVQKQFDEGYGNGNSPNNGRLLGKIKQTDLEQLHISGKRPVLVADFIGQDDCSAPKDNIDRNICNYMKISEIDEQHSSGAKSSALSSDSPTGLQLGKRTYPLDVMLPVAAKATSKPNAASKKTRGSASASQVPRCQVEGCKLDLSSAKDYHRRHKVCEQHSKAGKVVVASLEQRFCQQCSRFHILTEFDETKRSCRRRLAGHNKRRRKPRPDPLELQAQLRSSFEDWPFFNSSRLSRLGCWQDAAQSQSRMLWPRKLVEYYAQPSLDCSFEGSGPDLFMKGFSSPRTHDRFPLCFLQSPKTVMSTSLCDQRLDNHLPDIVGGAAFGNCPRLASVTSGPGVSTNTGTTPGMEVTRVSNSGRALSLLSLQVQCSQAPDMVSLDLSGPINTSINDNSYQVQDAVASAQRQFLLHGQHPYRQDFSTTLSMSSNMRHSAAANVCEEGSIVIADRDLFESSFLSSLHRHGGDYQGNGSCLASGKRLGSHGITEQAKETQDLMQLVSFQVPNGHCQSPSAIFNLDSNSSLSEPHLPAETSFLRF